MAVKMNKWDKMGQDYYNKTGRDPVRDAFSMPADLAKKKNSAKKKPAKKSTKEKVRQRPEIWALFSG